MIDPRIIANFYIAFEAVLANRVRSILTALGIIFGVAAVIAMLAIGAGAQEEILNQIKLVGVNNIVIAPIIEQTEENLQEATNVNEKKKFSPGLSLRDVASIKKVIPKIQRSSPEIILDTHIISSGIRRSAKLIGVEPDYFEIIDFHVSEGGIFSDEQLLKGLPVCIIGQGVKSKFFPTSNPLGKKIKCGRNWLEVIGVLEGRIVSESSISKLGIRDYNMDVYTPVQTVLSRYRNRSLITAEMLRMANAQSSGRGNNNNAPAVSLIDSESDAWFSKNYHQIDRLVVQVEETNLLTPVAEVISRLLERRHYGVIDYEITIPELLLKQEQRTKKIFNIVLFAIAAISLIVGGIGIMNIMLASVLERIKEIGLRISLGAKKRDIVFQFLFESMMISITGGLIGIVLGVVLAIFVSNIADIPTIITFSSIFISFGVAASVGLIFGITPAKKAAQQDPITSLRYE